jgi:toxin-antitoxin system PIN domain toxin
VAEPNSLGTSGGAPQSAPLVDANLIIWAHHRQFSQHHASHEWWRRLLSERPMVGIPWSSILAFVRISTHPRALERPLDVASSWRIVESWLDRANVWVPVPTERHRSIIAPLLESGKATGNHVPDAHLAALAIEWGLELQSADRDFARYPGLRWRDPFSD